MARDVFPRVSDRHVVTDFMRGVPSTLPSDLDVTTLTSEDGHLKDGGHSVLWFGPDGSLQATIQPGAAEHSWVRLINHVLETLSDDRRLVRESTEAGTVSVWVLDGTYVRAGTPFVLAGALTVQAWRAANK